MATASLQTELVSSIVRELLGGHAPSGSHGNDDSAKSPAQQRSKRFSYLVDQLRTCILGTSEELGSQNTLMIKELDTRGEVDARVWEWLDTCEPRDQSVRSRVHKAECCDVTIVVVHSPQCRLLNEDQDTTRGVTKIVGDIGNSDSDPTLTKNATNGFNYSQVSHTGSKDFSPIPTDLGPQEVSPQIWSIPMASQITTNPGSEFSEIPSSGASHDPDVILDCHVSHVVKGKRNTRAVRRQTEQRVYAKWTPEMAVRANELIEEATHHDGGDGFSNYSVRRMAQRLCVSQSSLYKYLRLTRPDTQGGPRKVLDLSGRRGLTEGGAVPPASASYMELTDALYAILVSSEPMTVTEIRDRLPVHLRKSKPSILRHLKRMNCLRRSVSALNACNSSLNSSVRGPGNCHNLSGYWSIGRSTESDTRRQNDGDLLRTRPIPEPDVSVVGRRNQVMVLRKAYADCVLSLSPNPEKTFGSLLFVSHLRWPAPELSTSTMAPEPSGTSCLFVDVMITMSVRGVVDYAVNVVRHQPSPNLPPDHQTNVDVASTFVPFVRRTVRLINNGYGGQGPFGAATATNSGPGLHPPPLVLVVDRGPAPEVEVALDEARHEMAFADPSHSLIYLPPDSLALNPVNGLAHEIVRATRAFAIKKIATATEEAEDLGQTVASYLTSCRYKDMTPYYERCQSYIMLATDFVNF